MPKFFVSRFTDISMADAGEYICSAKNPVGQATAIASVVVQSPPVLTVYPKPGRITVREGDGVRFECRATGSPQPTVQWIVPPSQTGIYAL